MQIIHTDWTDGTPYLTGADGAWSVCSRGGKLIYTLKRSYRTAYGFGEKFDSVNQKGKLVRAAVIEKCFYQGEFTYLSMPFFLTADGFGVYVETYKEVVFDFRKEGVVSLSFEQAAGEAVPKIYFFTGTPKEIVAGLKEATAPTKVFPKWVLGAWMSSNRWRRQNEVEEEARTAKELNFPHSVLVIEPWSDVSTHYLWAGVDCPVKPGDGRVRYDEMDFTKSECWKDPKAMVDALHKDGLRVLLWVVPVCPAGEAVESDEHLDQVAADVSYALEHGECVHNADGSDYKIPHTWFVGTYVPDFTNPAARENRLGKFDHLLEIGIDGFKTDGGEFIHTDQVQFADGTPGNEGRNAYCEQYFKAFHDYIGEGRALFSRAGGSYAAAHTVSWAGDQESTWPEFRSVLKAGLSAGLSGISNWGFDIAGFAGYLPTKGLYARAVQAAAFTPVMQWHSEPPKNGRCDFTRAWPVNDRSPWNVARFHKDPKFLEMLRRHFFLHYNLIPYQYALMLEASRTGVPAMRHLVYEFPDDPNAFGIEDEFMLGDALLVAPVTEDYEKKRSVYLPEGTWRDLYTGKAYAGGKAYSVTLSEDRIPAFLREGKCVPVNVRGGKLATDVGNRLDEYCELSFLVSGSGSYRFEDDLGNDIAVAWTKDCETVKQNRLRTECRFLRLDRGSVFEK